MKDKHIRPIGSIVVAKKDMFMKDFKDNDQFLTKNKEYTIVANPLYYNAPIIIIDDAKMEHHCNHSWFK